MNDYVDSLQLPAPNYYNGTERAQGIEANDPYLQTWEYFDWKFITVPGDSVALTVCQFREGLCEMNFVSKVKYNRWSLLEAIKIRGQRISLFQLRFITQKWLLFCFNSQLLSAQSRKSKTDV